jgi:restriction system protein
LIPDFQTIMLPILVILRDQNEHQLGEVTATIEDQFNLTEQERAELVPNGRKRKIYDRVAWAATYLRKANLIFSNGRGKLQITKRGLEALQKNPNIINTAYLSSVLHILLARPE